uniref:Homoserine kinase n=1 Tax=Zooxanthella nutricula TaxID=1333877 RepID=A0A7S2P894_9DINO
MLGDAEIEAFASKYALDDSARAELKKMFTGVVSGTRRRVTVRVPATTANMGPGFDCAGMALDIWNEVTVERAAVFSFEIEGEGAGVLPRTSGNLVCKGVEAAFKAIGKEVPVLRYWTRNRIPFAKGMGSSSAAIVSGILAGLAIAGFNLQVKGEEELLQIATNIEGHPDNVAPCIYGGFQLGIHNGTRWWTDRVSMPHGLMCVVFAPDHATETSAARDLLKAQVDVKDAVFNCGRVGLLVAAFATNNLEWLRLATEDALHQPQRAPMHTHLNPLIRAALDAGAHGACLSGAGPAVIAFTGGRAGDVIAQNHAERKELEVAEAFLAAADAINCPGQVIITKPIEHGGYIVSETVSYDPAVRRQRIHYVQD